MRYVGGTDERGRPIDVKDPLAPRLKALSDAAATPAAKAAALLAVAEIFPKPLAADPGFRADLTAAAETLAAQGTRAAVSRFRT